MKPVDRRQDPGGRGRSVLPARAAEAAGGRGLPGDHRRRRPRGHEGDRHARARPRDLRLDDARGGRSRAAASRSRPGCARPRPTSSCSPPRARSATSCSALETGADDYLIKPCDQGELMARVRAGVAHRDADRRTLPSHGRTTAAGGERRAAAGMSAARRSPAGSTCICGSVSPRVQANGGWSVAPTPRRPRLAERPPDPGARGPARDCARLAPRAGSSAGAAPRFDACEPA